MEQRSKRLNHLAVRPESVPDGPKSYRSWLFVPQYYGRLHGHRCANASQGRAILFRSVLIHLEVTEALEGSETRTAVLLRCKQTRR